MTSVHLASSSNIVHNAAINSSTVTFSFNTPVKLDQSNYLIWRSQVLASIRGNRLEKFIDESVTPPPSHTAQRVGDDLRSVENPEYITWRSQDHMLLGWLLSSMSEGIISLVFSLETSLEVWKAIKVQFGSQSKSKLLHLRYMMNSTRKDDLKVTDYFIKMKNIADNMAAAGSALSDNDLILHILSGLGPEYNSVATYITGQIGVGKMNVNEAYTMLLTQEARIEQQAHMLAGMDEILEVLEPMEEICLVLISSKEDTLVIIKEIEGTGIRILEDMATSKLEEFIASSAYKPPPNRNPKSAYLANMDGASDTNWYLDSGVTHHLTNDMNNMHSAEPFAGISKLVVGNGAGLSITHLGHATLKMLDGNTNAPFTLNLTNILLVPQITKNLISISQLTKDNNVIVEFTDKSCFVKDKTYSLPASNSNLNTFAVDAPAQMSPSSLAPVSNSQPTTITSTHHMITRAKAGIFKPKAFLTSHNSLEPNTPSEALSDPNWKAAMQTEYDALIKNNTWSLIPICSDFKVVGCKWVFRTKYNTNGSISKHKARLVAKGFHQTAGVDYSETFSPVIKSSTVRVILSLAVMQGWKVRQIDINNAFLNGDLTEDVYMTQPEGFTVKEGYVCKLNKALYGLKQAPRAWYDKLKHCLTTWNFFNSKADTSLFIKHDIKGLIIVLIYVDDILVTRLDSAALEEFIAKLSKVFALKDLGLLAYFLGVEVCYTDHGMHLSQTKYIKDLLGRASMQDCKGTDTPFSTGLKLERHARGPLGQEFENPTLYRSLVRDADWACDIDDRKSIGAYCIYLGNNLISWSSKKQGVVAKSSTESEYRALSSACSELSWLQSLFSELNIAQLPTSVLWCDNQSAGALARNPVFHSKSKHIELNVHYIRDKVLSKELEVRYIPTEEQVADILTKPLS
ncbi:retrovirus-related pol polyprotein from transposon RE1 [Citrus sinensis]|uniref:Retrovirus-related pol polyprotein from transposon RE1 n=1 Tax=Citrus sinensis TaxID=2711 RepID=A0ACB8I7M1_CITSI|nr:retrovirus-related pol polyprotein from transposon RE1 [Citrus sinensis]